MARQRGEGQLIKWCVSFDQAVSRSSEVLTQAQFDWNEVLGMAARQGVSSYLLEFLPHLSSLVVPPAALKTLQRVSSDIARQNRLNADALTALLLALRRANIQVLLLKGVALLNTVYRGVEHLRPCKDIDLLVRKADLSRIHEVLLGLGYEPLAAFPSSLERTYQLPLYIRPGGAFVEIHFDLVRPHTPFQVVLSELWERAREVQISGERALVMSPEDMILHAAVHLSWQKEFLKKTLSQLRDLSEIVAKESVDWTELHNRAQRYRASRAVYYGLFLARRILHAPIPDDVFPSLTGGIGRWESLLFAQLMEEEGFLTLRNPLRLWIQTTLLQVAGYGGIGRMRMLLGMLRHPFAYNKTASRILLPHFYSPRFRLRHTALVGKLFFNTVGIALAILTRSIQFWGGPSLRRNEKPLLPM